MSLAIDSSTPAYTAIAGSATSATTGSFTPPSSSVIFVVVAVAGGSSAQSVSSITNSGTALTWAKRVASTSTGSVFGVDHPDAEVWWAYCATSAAMTVTVNLAVAALASGGIVLPIVFTGASSTQTGNTGTGSSNSDVSSYSAALTTSAAGSWVVGAFVDWDGYVPTPTTGQTLTVNGHSANDANTYVGQIYSAVTASSGTSAPLSGTFATATGYVTAVAEVLASTTTSTTPILRTAAPPRRLVAPPRGKRTLPTPAQIPVPPTIPGNRQKSALSKLAAASRGRRSFVPSETTTPAVGPKQLKRPRARLLAPAAHGRRFTPQTDLGDPAVAPKQLKRPRARILTPSRGHQPFPVQPQIPVPPTIPGNRASSLARRLFAIDPHGRRSFPTPAQIPVPPTVPGNPFRTRARALTVAKGRQWIITQVTDRPAGIKPASSRIPSVRRGRQTNPVTTQVITPPPWTPGKLGVARRLLNTTARGHQTFPTPPQIPVPPTIPGNRAPAGRRLAGIIRGHRATIVDTAPSSVQPSRTRPATRPTGSRRGRQTNPILAQATATTPAWPPSKLGAARRLLNTIIHGKRSAVTPPQIPIPSWPPRQTSSPKRTFVTSRRARPSLVATHAQHAPIIPTQRVRPRSTIPRRGHRTDPPYTTTAPIAPSWVQTRVAPKPRLTLQRRGHRFDPAWGTISPAPTICYPTAALVVPYATASTIIGTTTTPTITAYTTTTLVPARTTSSLVAPYASTPTLSGHQTAPGIVTYTSGIIHFNTCND